MFANITPPGSGRPRRSPIPWPELAPSPDPFLYLKYKLLYDIYHVKRDLAGAAERGSPRTGGTARKTAAQIGIRLDVLPSLIDVDNEQTVPGLHNVALRSATKTRRTASAPGEGIHDG